MAGNDVFLNPGAANPNDVILRDPLTNSIASGGISVTSATTDGADITAGNVGVLVASSSATNDGADVTAASVGAVIASSSATTDGQDVTASSAAVVVSASSATTDGADVSAGQASPTVSAVSATTDGQDVTAASASPVIGVSSNTTDGADVTASSVQVVIGVTSNTTDGADISAANAEIVELVSSGGAGFETGGALIVSRKPLLQQIMEARAARIKPAKKSMRRKARAIEAQAVDLVLAGGGESAFNELMRQWAKQEPVLPAQPTMNLEQLFMAQIAIHIRRIEQQDEEDALIALLIA